MQVQNYMTVPSEREKLNIIVEEVKRSAFNCTTVEQDRRDTYKRDIEARSRNHFCGGKSVSITYCVCILGYSACNAHAPYYIGIFWPVLL
jgi:hypothetical protein